MRCRVISGLLLFVTALALLRSSILLLDATVAVRAEHSALVHHHDIDPAALFYTDSAQALAAEKQVRSRIAGTSP